MLKVITALKSQGKFSFNLGAEEIHSSRSTGADKGRIAEGTKDKGRIAEKKQRTEVGLQKELSLTKEGLQKAIRFFLSVVSLRSKS